MVNRWEIDANRGNENNSSINHGYRYIIRRNNSFSLPLSSLIFFFFFFFTFENYHYICEVNVSSQIKIEMSNNLLLRGFGPFSVSQFQKLAHKIRFFLTDHLAPFHN
jgi:hypothetical protein